MNTSKKTMFLVTVTMVGSKTVVNMKDLCQCRDWATSLQTQSTLLSSKTFSSNSTNSPSSSNWKQFSSRQQPTLDNTNCQWTRMTTFWQVWANLTLGHNNYSSRVRIKAPICLLSNSSRSNCKSQVSNFSKYRPMWTIVILLQSTSRCLLLVDRRNLQGLRGLLSNQMTRSPDHHSSNDKCKSMQLWYQYNQYN